MSDANEWVKERRAIQARSNDGGFEDVSDAIAMFPRILTAVEKVLELHQATETGVGDQYWKEPDYCPTCSEYYPCPTVRAIEGATSD